MTTFLKPYLNLARYLVFFASGAVGDRLCFSILLMVLENDPFVLYVAVTHTGTDHARH
jgi:hypothetical protein